MAGKYTESEEISLACLESHERVLGKDHPETLSSLNSLAVQYRKEERWLEAEPMLLRAYESRRRVLGDEHPRTLASMNG